MIETYFPTGIRWSGKRGRMNCLRCGLEAEWDATLSRDQNGERITPVRFFWYCIESIHLGHSGEITLVDPPSRPPMAPKTLKKASKRKARVKKQISKIHH